MDPGLMVGLGVGGLLSGIVVWAVFLQPRWLQQAFADSARRMRKSLQQVSESPADYAQSRGLKYSTMGEVTKLQGQRLLWPTEAGGPALQVDLLALKVQRGRKLESTSVLLFHCPLPGGHLLRIQRCSGFMRTIYLALLRLVTDRLPEGFSFESGTRLDQDHLVGTDDLKATQALLDSEGCDVIERATAAVAKLVGANTACLIRYPQGLTLLVQQPTAALVKEDSLRAFASAFRPVAEWVEARSPIA